MLASKSLRTHLSQMVMGSTPASTIAAAHRQATTSNGGDRSPSRSSRYSRKNSDSDKETLGASGAQESPRSATRDGGQKYSLRLSGDVLPIFRLKPRQPWPYLSWIFLKQTLILRPPLHRNFGQHSKPGIGSTTTSLLICARSLKRTANAAKISNTEKKILSLDQEVAKEDKERRV